ncbi:MAG: fluoride efflux transporter CrcB [Gammaproteobacteria bacterium]|nr:fluoride efflux transporter CrcB [Gammaproteobacteria bacterium]
MFRTYVLIGAGGALGAMARYGVVLAVGSGVGGSSVVPWGTLLVNVAGSLAIGFIVGSLSDTAALNSIARPFLIVGFLGAFTTFSAFSMETLTLLQSGRLGIAALYTSVSVVACVVAAWLGLRLGQ